MPMYPSPKAGGGVRHLVATKSFLLNAVDAYGAKAVLTDWDGTDDEAKDAIREDSREVIPIDCDHYDAKGYCLGHTRWAPSPSEVCRRKAAV